MLYATLPTDRRPYADFQFGLSISANSVRNIDTATKEQKAIYLQMKKITIYHLGQGSGLGYNSMFIILAI